MIDIEIKSELTQLFAVLRSDLKRLAGEYNISELDVAILTAQLQRRNRPLGASEELVSIGRMWRSNGETFSFEGFGRYRR